jgi:hypothetical protein
VDGEVLDIKTGTDQAAPLGSAQQLERKQHAAPGICFETGSEGEGIPLLRSRIIKSAGDPVFGAVSSELFGAQQTSMHVVLPPAISSLIY